MSQQTSQSTETAAATPARAWPRFLDPFQASEYLHEVWGLTYSRGTLSKLRCTGGGPQFRKANRSIRYTAIELDRWAEELLGDLRRSTSDAGEE